MTIFNSLSWNPDDPDSVAAATRQFIADNHCVVLAVAVTDRIAAVLADASEGRREYLRVVAEASPHPADTDALIAAVGGSGSVGPVHRNLEQAWRTAGGTGRMVDTPARMHPAVAILVLELLDATEPS